MVNSRKLQDSKFISCNSEFIAQFSVYIKIILSVYIKKSECGIKRCTLPFYLIVICGENRLPYFTSIFAVFSNCLHTKSFHAI